MPGPIKAQLLQSAMGFPCIWQEGFEVLLRKEDLVREVRVETKEIKKDVMVGIW